jgi:hypothetical protein
VVRIVGQLLHGAGPAELDAQHGVAIMTNVLLETINLVATIASPRVTHVRYAVHKP